MHITEQKYPLYPRVYSYPCLEVYLDKHEVSINMISLVVKLGKKTLYLSESDSKFKEVI